LRRAICISEFSNAPQFKPDIVPPSSLPFAFPVSAPAAPVRDGGANVPFPLHIQSRPPRLHSSFLRDRNTLRPRGTSPAAPGWLDEAPRHPTLFHDLHRRHRSPSRPAPFHRAAPSAAL